MSEFYVYTITSMDSGEVLYVGKGRGFRWKQSLKRIETISSTQCEVFIENVSSNELALKKETKLIQSLSPTYNKRVSWRKIKTGSSLTKLSVTVPFEFDLVSTTKTHAGFNYELVQIGDNLFKLLITKSGEGFETAEFSLSTKRDGILRITTNGTGVTEPSKTSSIEHKLVYDYVIAALSSVQNLLNILGYDFTVYVTKAEYNEVRFGFESNPVYGTCKVLDYFTGICGRVERAKTKALGVANCLNFKFKDYVSKTTGLPCGVTFNKQAGTYNIFSLSLYRKDLEVMDRDAEGRAGELEKDSMGLVKNRMRVESHIFPPMFYRGRAKKFKQIFLGVDLERMSKKEEDMQKYFGSVRFLEDSQATVETLKQCIAEISYQLGLHLIFAAESPKEVYSRMTEGASEEELELARIWKSGKEITPEVVGMPKNKFYDLVNSIEERVGFLPTKVPVSTFNWIRSSLMYSMLTEKEHDLMCALDNTLLGSSEYGKSGKIMLELKKKAADRATASLESMRVAAKSFGMLKS